MERDGRGMDPERGQTIGGGVTGGVSILAMLRTKKLVEMSNG